MNNEIVWFYYKSLKNTLGSPFNFRWYQLKNYDKLEMYLNLIYEK